MKIRFWGTRGSIAVPGKDTVKYGGNTTCLEIILSNGDLVIIDAGTGIRPLGDDLLERGQPVRALLLMTHIHWDHILGFPFFAPLYDPATKLVVDGCARAPWGLRIVFETKMRDGLFPVSFDHLKSNIRFRQVLEERPLETGSALIQSMPLQHPNGGLGFRISDEGKSLVFLTDNELMPQAWTGRKPQDYARFCRDADLLIHDGQYTPEEIRARRGWGHSDFRSVLELAGEAGVKRLILTHHDPAHSDRQIDEMTLRCRQEAEEMGLTVDIDSAREESLLL